MQVQDVRRYTVATAFQHPVRYDRNFKAIVNGKRPYTAIQSHRDILASFLAV